MRPSDSSLFTPAEAAVLTRLSLKAVNNAIDKNMVPAVVRSGTTDSGRFLDQRALLALALEYRLANRFFPELRRRLFDALAASPRKAVLSVDEGLVKVDLQEPRRDLAASLRALRRARSLVVTDAEILGGDPVFRGTRVPVHVIAAMLEQATEAEILKAYPRITVEMVRLAPAYAQAYPIRGRPRSQPWRDRPPVQRSRERLS
jgi:uncharacterized protein (DUF433 family)